MRRRFISRDAQSSLNVQPPPALHKKLVRMKRRFFMYFPSFFIVHFPSFLVFKLFTSYFSRLLIVGLLFECIIKGKRGRVCFVEPSSSLEHKKPCPMLKNLYFTLNVLTFMIACWLTIMYVSSAHVYPLDQLFSIIPHSHMHIVFF